MAGVTGKSVTVRQSDEDVANANNPQYAAKAFSNSYAEGDITTENDEDARNKNSNKPTSIEMSKTPVPGPSSSSGVTVTVTRSKSEKEKKVGHRRVTEGGDVTYKKIQTSQIMGSIQLGVQHAIGGLASKPERDLLMQDFMTVEQTLFPNGGSNQTPAHHYSDFRFKTYAPIAFRYFRDLFGIQPDDFLMSMCSVPMRELSNPGASGSIFYLTDDDEFIVKTVQHKECEFLQKLLPGYYMNLNQNPRTLLPKFFGLFCYQCNSKNVRLAVMNNLLPSSVKMHQKYDLKGSTYKRKANKSEREKAFPTFKDLDFVEHHPDGILLEADTCSALLKTMQRDCRVLESFKIMDYSLLVGIHNLDIAAREKAERKAKQLDSDDEDEECEFTPGQGLSRSKSINRQKLVAHSTALESIQAESEPIDADEDVPPGGIPARNAKGERLLLFLGLIDILQSYRLKKKLEHTFKAMIHDGDTVSVHRPGFYAERFMNFMSKSVFRKIPSLDMPEVKGNHRKFRNLVSTFLALKHSPSKKRGPPMRIKSPGEGDGLDSSIIGSPTSVATSPPRISPPEEQQRHNPQQQQPPQHQGIFVNKRNSSGATINVSVANKEKESKSVTIQDKSGDINSGELPISPPQPQAPTYPAVLSKHHEHQPSRPSSMNRGKAPPPVPPRSPRPRNGTSTSSTGEGSVANNACNPPVSTPPPPFTSVLRENPGQSVSQQWNLTQSQSPSRRIVSSNNDSPGRHHHHPHGSAESDHVSISEVYVETRGMHRSSLSVASSSTTSGISSSHKMQRSPPQINRNASATPTWTEGTPSFTESSSSDLGEDYLGCPTTPVKGIGERSERSGVKEATEENEHEMV